MKLLIRSSLCALVVTQLMGCDHDIDEVSATIDSQSSVNAASVCSVVTVHNQLRTHREKTPSEPRVRMNVLEYTYNYDVYATSEASAEYQNQKLGHESKTINDIYQERVCARQRADYSCARHEWRDYYRPVIKYGESKAISVKYNNLVTQAASVPSHFSFGLLNMYLGSYSIGEEIKELNFVAPDLLPCYYTHLITLYNANLAPEGSVSSGRAKTASGVQAAVSIASFPLLTKSEMERLTESNGHLPTIRELQTTYNTRAADLSKYLSKEATGKDAAAFIAQAIQNGNWSEAYSMARKKVSNDPTVSADEVLAVLPDTARVIGSELAPLFARAVAEALTLQGKLERSL